MEQLTGENRSTETVLSGLTGELDQVSAKIEALQEERRKADEAGRDQERRKAALDLQRLEQEKDLAAAKAERERLAARQEDSRNRLAEIRERIAELERSIQTDRSAIEAGSMRLEQLAEQTVTANERIRQSEETRRDCEQKVSSLRSQSRELSARKETHAREAARLDERLQAAGSERDQVVAKLWESYRAHPHHGSAAGVRPRGPGGGRAPSDSGAQPHPGSGQRQCGRCGGISRRYPSGTASCPPSWTMWKSPSGNWAGSIEELTSQMRQLFLESFGEINRHFGQIFTGAVRRRRGQNCPLERRLLTSSALRHRDQGAARRARSSRTWRRSRAANRPLWRSAIYFAILQGEPGALLSFSTRSRRRWTT